MAENRISEEPLLPENEKDTRVWCERCENEHVRIKSRRRLSSQIRSWVPSIATHLLAGLLFVPLVAVVCPEFLLTIVRTLRVQPLGIPSLYSPLKPNVQYEIRKPDPEYWSDDLYVGDPSWESDRAWNKLIHPHGMRVYDDEAKNLGLTRSIPLTKGGYSSILGVYHNLHCLRRIRQYFFHDYYYPNATTDELEHLKYHELHCMESLRTSIMCHPDLTAHPYYFSGDPMHPVNVATDIEIECVNWEFLKEFTMTREFEKVEYGENVTWPNEKSPGTS